MVQAISCFITFLALCRKHKSLAKAFLAVSAVGGIAGGAMLYLHARDRLRYRKMLMGQDDYSFDENYDELSDLDNISSYDGVDELYVIDGLDDLPF